MTFADGEIGRIEVVFVDVQKCDDEICVVNRGQSENGT